MLAPSPDGDAGPMTTSSDSTSPRTNASNTREKPRSCATCAQRKVKCDKRYPCSRCRHAGVPCVLPSIDPRPQWARRIVSRAGNDAQPTSIVSTPASVGVGKVRDRLKVLEKLVQDLSCELESSTAGSQPKSTPSTTDSSTHAIDISTATPQAGRVILDDSDRVRYVSSGFWSRIDHELDSLKEETRGYEPHDVQVADGAAQNQYTSVSTATEANQTLLGRHAFLLNHHISFVGKDASALMPMASQIPFLLEVYYERIHAILALPHMPSLKKCLQKRRGAHMQGTPSEEALIFAVFYAAICSLEEEDVKSSFNVPKGELLSQYRIGVEHNLAKADFLTNPSSTLIEAYVIFLALARRIESPKYVWMMAGLIVRMAHYLGIHRDGSGSKHITPYQVEMQRRIWWALTALDMRVTEDQGSELAISHGSYTTKSPSNINDADIWPEMTTPPRERYGPTEATFLRLCSDSARTMQDSMAAGTTVTIDEHNHRLSDLKQKWESEYLSLPGASQHQTYLAAAGTLRVILGRLMLLSFPPVVYSSPDASISPEIRTKLLLAAIEVAEHNHALNTEPSCQPWRWVYQTQQHWHAVIYLLIEICRRPWSSTMERAWMALQSPWLVPIRTPIDKSLGIWTPVRKLMVRARKHRENEITRLQLDPERAAQIEEEDQQQIPVPSSSTTFPTYFDPELFRKKWRQLVHPPGATTISTADNISSAVAGMNNSINFEGGFSSSTNAIHQLGIGSGLYVVQPPLASAQNGGLLPSASDSWSGATMDLADTSNLDDFLGIDMNMDFDDLLNDANTFDFDWNSWFESIKGDI